VDIASGAGFWVAGGWLTVTGCGFSLEQPTAIEQTINSAAKTSALAVLLDLIESWVDAKLLAKLMRVMVGHLLLLSSA